MREVDWLDTVWIVERRTKRTCGKEYRIKKNVIKSTSFVQTTHIHTYMKTCIRIGPQSNVATPAPVGTFWRVQGDRALDWQSPWSVKDTAQTRPERSC